LAGHGSEALLLGIFQVSVLHNIVHLLFGVAGILMARTDGQARNFLLYGGVVYLVLWLYGLLIGHDTPANFVPVNDADNWLHLVLGLAMIALAVALSRGTARGADRR
jgi:arginine exporter protein ArgO